MSITASQWASLLYLSRSDFYYPDRLEFPVVQALDRLAGKLGSKPQVLDDYREYSPENPGSKHPLGIAIDTTWPGLDSLTVLDAAFSETAFGGIGIYINEQNAVSFHFDTRDKKTDNSLYTWGGKITHPLDPLTGEHIKRIEYVALNIIVDIIKKKGLLLTSFLIMSGLIIWIFIKN